MPRTLAETQALLWRLITAPEGVERGLAALTAAEQPEGGLEGVVRSGASLGAVERLDVYANMYFFRLRDVIAEDYPAVAQVLGETDFHNLVTDYLLAHPPSHPSIRHAGERLPIFLEGHLLRKARPWLADLARFEWAIIDAFDAPDAGSLAAGALRELPAEDWARIRFALTPSLVRLEAGFRIDLLWQRATSGEAIVVAEESPSRFRVWRKGHRVLHRVLDGAEDAALAAALAAKPFAEICEGVGRVIPTAEAPHELLRILERWMDDEMIVGFSLDAR